MKKEERCARVAAHARLVCERRCGGGEPRSFAKLEWACERVGRRAEERREVGVGA